jgi:nitrous oxide reductase accessory protein NosL
MIRLFLIVVFSVTLSFGIKVMPFLQQHYSMDITKETTCLVRHLKVYKEPRWACKIEVKNGKKVYFCSPKSMFEFYHRPGKWYFVGVRHEKDFKDIIVTDYNNMKLLNAKEAYFVYGSRAISPAGDDLPAFATKKEAEEFAKKYGGKRVLRFEQISPALINLLNGRI